LSRFRDLFVIARNSTFRYKGQAVDVRQLNKELGARYVLEGSVQKAGDTLRVTVQLLDAKDGTHLWADTYDRKLSAANIFAVQDAITEQVVATIAGVHGVISRKRFSELKKKPTENLDAYECVLRVRAYYYDRYIATEHAKLRECLERGVKSDPSYAEAWARLSNVYLDEYRFNYNPRPNPLDRALDAAQRAVASDSANQIAHEALALVYFFRHERDAFLAEAERAIALNPNHAFTVALMGERLNSAGDERGVAFVKKAIKLDPFHPSWFNFTIADDHFRRGEYEEALAEAQKVKIPGTWWPQAYLAAIYAELGNQSGAQSAIARLLEIYPGFSIKKFIWEWRKWDFREDVLRLWVAALRKAGLPE
jgi:adenylate cyclase